MPVCIFSTENQLEAGLLKGALDENNIDNHLENYSINNAGLSFGGILPGVSGSPYAENSNIRVFVKEEDSEKALEITEALFGNGEESLASE